VVPIYDRATFRAEAERIILGGEEKGKPGSKTPASRSGRQRR
jgi:hypothetical protein